VCPDEGEGRGLGSGRPAEADHLVALVIEDNEKNLKLVRDVLQLRGFRTLEARTAAEGIGLACEHLPTIVLMDVQLPDMDGVAALG
jgi:two-component system cell cycle response regulator DivK